MYLPPGNAVQTFWTALAGLLAQRLERAVPARLDWPQNLHAHWLEPALLLSQTCGYPLSTALRHKVQLVGTFAYQAPGASAISCKSQLVRKSTDPRTLLAHFAGSTLAFNSRDSQSGFNALRALVGETQVQRPFFGAALETGGHFASLEMVRSGQADMAAVDCVSLALWRDTYPEKTSDIAVFAETAQYPGLPLITALNTPPATLLALRECLMTVALDERYAAVRAPLRIIGFEVTRLEDYAVCLHMEKAGVPLFDKSQTYSPSGA